MRVFVQNLGKYNEGYIVGDWIDLPKSRQEIDDYLRNVVGLQLTQKEVDEALRTTGVCYEEYMIADYETELTCWDYNEYANIHDLNLLAAYEEKARNIDIINAYCEENNIDGIEEICNVIEQEDEILAHTCNYDCFMNDDELLGNWYVDECLCGAENIPTETLENYFDYEALGRDLRIEYSPEDDIPPTAEEYWCGDEHATDEQIGERCVDEFGFEGINNKDYYFDYEAFGRDLRMDGFSVINNNYGNAIILESDSSVDTVLYAPLELFDLIDLEGYTENEPEIEMGEN